MSKTFSNAGGNRDIRVIDDSGRGFVIRALDHDGARSIAVIFNNDTAPALALAILEAAGFDDVDSGNISCAVADLRAYIERQERITAEARERAELEAEALELFNVNQGINLPDWGNADRAVISSWVRVARRARELANEATK